MRATKVRETIAKITALIAVIVLFTGIAVVAGWNIPGIRWLADLLGF